MRFALLRVMQPGNHLGKCFCIGWSRNDHPHIQEIGSEAGTLLQLLIFLACSVIGGNVGFNHLEEP
jgi:hypothetical protein